MPLAGSLTKGKVQRASTCTAPWLTLTEPQKTKGIATETCMDQEEEEGPRGHRGEQAAWRSLPQAIAGKQGGKPEGRCTQLIASWTSAQEARRRAH